MSKVSDLLERAADWLDSHQLTKHQLWDNNISPTAACARGALLEAAGLRDEVNRGDRYTAFQSPTFLEADIALNRVVGGYVPTWNNDNDRTKAEVVKAMRQAADNVRFSDV